MGSQNEQDERIDILRVMMERLSGPELTLAESKDLRGQVSDLLERGDGPAGGDRTGSSPALVPYHDVGNRPRWNVWSPEPSMKTAG